MKIATWNVNSIRSRKNLALQWLKDNKPDVLLLQETKCLDEAFPKEEFEDLGYNISLSGQKTFNGVAILSLHPIEDVITKFEGNPLEEQARYIEAVICVPGFAVRVASVYVPNGESLDSSKYQKKFEFYDAINNHFKNILKQKEILVIGGDFNVAPEEIDTYSIDATKDTVLFDLKIRSKLRSIINLGLYDAFRLKYPNEAQFSWWDYRGGAWHKNKGLRIDHLLISPEAADILGDVEIDSAMRGKDSPSDHAPVAAILKNN